MHYLAEEYRRHGHDVVVLCQRSRLLDRRPMPVQPGYPIVRIGAPLPLFGKLGVHRWLVSRALIARHRRLPFDVLHTHHLGGPTAAGVAAKQAVGVPVVATTCGGDVQTVASAQHGDRRTSYQADSFRYSLRHADVIACVNRAIQTEIEREGTTARLVQIPNGVHWDAFQQPASGSFRRRISVETGDPLVVSVGRNRPVKGYEVGLEAFARARRPGVHYSIVGRGTHRLRSVVSALGLVDVVHLVDEVTMEEMPEIYATADVFFNPSFSEGFAQVNAQAMAAGTALVLSDVPGNREAAAGGTAAVGEAGDPVSLGTALRSVLDDVHLRRRLGAAAHERSRQLAWPVLAQRYLELFEELVATR